MEGALKSSPHLTTSPVGAQRLPHSGPPGSSVWRDMHPETILTHLRQAAHRYRHPDPLWYTEMMQWPWGKTLPGWQI